ncbi:MAG: hypothetical protein MI862_02935, partial [Desulfobacterales bacterium]|nr:hypothetical protein [Desulfobacterales bacterium]
LGLLSTIILAYFVKPKRRPLFIHISSLMLIMSLIALYWRTDWIGMLIFGILTGLFDPFFDIPFESFSFKVIEKDASNEDLRIEYIVARELPLNVGRMASILLFYLLIGAKIGTADLRAYLIFLIPAPIVISILLKGIRISE